MVTEQHNQAK